jgi:hypothetical protein
MSIGANDSGIAFRGLCWHSIDAWRRRAKPTAMCTNVKQMVQASGLDLRVRCVSWLPPHHDIRLMMIMSPHASRPWIPWHLFGGDTRAEGWTNTLVLANPLVTYDVPGEATPTLSVTPVLTMTVQASPRSFRGERQ